jgi:hypothetical protein
LAAGFFTAGLVAGLAATFGLAGVLDAGLPAAFGAGLTAALGADFEATLASGFEDFFAEGVMILLSFVTLAELWPLDREKPKVPRKPRFFESS